MNAVTAVETLTTRARSRAEDYMSGHPGAYIDTAYWVNGDRTFAYWLSQPVEESADRYATMTSLAHYILEEAYKVQRDLDHAEALTSGLYYPTPAPVEEHPEDAEIRAAFPGALPDDKLRKLRELVQERNALRAQVNAPIEVSDPRLTPAWVKAAQEADAAGYCSEYDRIAGAVGFPTRDELRERGDIEDPTWEVEVYVDFEWTETHTDRQLVTYIVQAGNSSQAVDEARDAFNSESENDTFERAEISNSGEGQSTTWDYAYNADRV